MILVVQCDCGSSAVLPGGPPGEQGAAPTPSSVFSGLKENRVVWTDGLGLGSDMVTCCAPAVERGSCKPRQECYLSGGSFCTPGRCAGPQLNPGLTEGRESPRWLETVDRALRR